MVALDAGVVRPDDPVDTGNGIFMYAGSRMTDHNAHKGGYHVITAAQSIWYSSNIGVAKIILNGFGKRPQDFVDGLYAIGLNKTVKLNIPGEGHPIIKHPIKDRKNWSMTSLPWMSFGYETQIPPIYTLMFYNAIANGGKMIKPIFVKEICKDGVSLQKMSTEIINPQICKPATLSIIQQMLEDVVTKGTAKAVLSDYIKIAGKTGTAQIAQGSAGYRGAGKKHRVSFCGYFPADNPQYSAIVVITAPRIGYPSGGTMSGGVVKNIAEQIYAQGIQSAITPNQPDTVHSHLPRIKNGNFKQTVFACDKMNLSYEDFVRDESWTKVSDDTHKVLLKGLSIEPKTAPDVMGMGARDAIYLLEQTGLKVSFSGKGRVISQSIPPGRNIVKGQTIAIVLK